LSEELKNELMEQNEHQLSTDVKAPEKEKNEISISTRTFLDTLEEETRSEVLEVGEYKGLKKDEAYELKITRAPESNLLNEIDKDGRVNIINREVNQLVLSQEPDQVRDVPFRDFPLGVKELLFNRFKILVLYLYLPVGVMWSLRMAGHSIWIVPFVITIFVALASLATYSVFKNKDYIELKGIVQSVQKSNVVFDFFLGRTQKYIVSVVTPDKKFFSFIYPKRLSNKIAPDLKPGTAITVFTHKTAKMVASEAGGRLEYLYTFEIGETSAALHDEFGEGVTAKEFAER
jgi:hypothetical protein